MSDLLTIVANSPDLKFSGLELHLPFMLLIILILSDSVWIQISPLILFNENLLVIVERKLANQTHWTHKEYSNPKAQTSYALGPKHERSKDQTEASQMPAEEIKG